MARSTRRDGRPGPESEGGRVVLFLILGLALVAGCLYVAAYVAASDKLPVGTRVAGVDVGGHRPDAAVTILRDRLADRVKAPFTVTMNGHTQQIRPGQVGLGVDYVASVRRTDPTRSWRPGQLWDHYTAGRAFEPVVTLDQLRLARLVRQLDRTDGRTAVDGSVAFGHDEIAVTKPVTGLQLDPKTTGQAFWGAYLSADPHLALQATATPPAIDTTAVRRFVNHFANPALAGSVVLSFGHTTVRLPPTAYAHLLGSQPAGHHLRPTVRALPLSRMVERRLRRGGPIGAPVDATVALVGGRPRVVKARPGVTFRPQDVAAALLKAIRAPRRTSRVVASLAPASFTNADARKLRIRHQISTVSLDLPKGSPSQLLISAALKLDDTVLKPGDTFSLRDRLGARVPGGARGTALATGLFNGAWLGGLKIGTHAASPSYTGQFPIGRDATLSQGRDLVFTDDTRYGVLVSVSVARPTSNRIGSLTVSLWSTPVWDITSSHSSRAKVVPAGTTVRHGRCHARAGREGFDVQVTRSFATRAAGAVNHHESYSVHYQPVPAVVCRPRHH